MDHIPVLLNEVLKYVNPGPDQNFIDATFGFGGHANAILEKNVPNGKVLGIEADPELYRRSVAEKNNRLVLVNDSYANLKKILAQNNFKLVHGILADLGMSSWHLEQSGKGLSFLKDEVLDMRYAARIGSDETQANPDHRYVSVSEIINTFSKEKLAEIFWEYGDEKFSRPIASKIVESRKIKSILTTFQLVDAIKAATPAWYSHKKIHPATKVFQALRIEANKELENLKTFLPQALEVLQKNGRLAIISFHSLEDRIVKNFFREKKQEGMIEILTKKAVAPTAEEIKNNFRSRSAKLRAAIKL